MRDIIVVNISAVYQERNNNNQRDRNVKRMASSAWRAYAIIGHGVYEHLSSKNV